ncbi:zinc-dependent metalloprotease [Modestobacter sp. Leaf380]|uniref:zinc-dependent metalloprotease n=1 Tax=Modestobacter sp. Leaf380 TaxID=1736356 RepID=UPI0006FDC7DD|nr:zinc-dependent metalloprotease [Modestobacter sp. Leaf380]KQS68609.1 coenzyme F420 biosynthesis-associated protein [Modestobacter sp. Leaf380]
MSSSLVDWSLAGRTARRLSKPGPETTRAEAAAVVAQLHECAAAAVAHVEALTGLAPSVDSPVPTVAVVDRPGWVEANTAGMAALLDPLTAALQERTGERPNAVVQAVGSRLTGVQAGAVLAFVCSKVLGQYEVFGSGGRLLLVAPNIVEAERRLRVDPYDFRLWVCLHEVTHQLQFTAFPWLHRYLEEQVSAFVEASDLDSGVLRERLRDVVASLADAVRGRPVEGDAPGGLMALIADPEQQAVLDRVTAVMSLVEGHAEFVMDGVGPDVIPTVRTLRKRFSQRRKGTGPVDRVLRRLLGLEQKMQQYADGRHFVAGVVDRVGMEAFNTVWTGPETLPLKEELTDPDRWVERVLHLPALR